MDLTILIVILLAGLLIKYLIDTINSLNDELKEIKSKCIVGNAGETFTIDTKRPTEKFNTELISSIKYFRDYFDDKKLYK